MAGDQNPVVNYAYMGTHRLDGPLTNLCHFSHIKFLTDFILCSIPTSARLSFDLYSFCQICFSEQWICSWATPVTKSLYVSAKKCFSLCSKFRQTTQCSDGFWSALQERIAQNRLCNVKKTTILHFHLSYKVTKYQVRVSKMFGPLCDVIQP